MRVFVTRPNSFNKIRLWMLVVVSLLSNLTSAVVPCGTPGHAEFGADGSELYDAARCVYIGAPILCGAGTNLPALAQGADATNAVAYYGSIVDWCTGLVVSFDNLFKLFTTFNEPITNWNTSSLVTMNSVFDSADAFNQPLLWDVSNVKDCSYAFQYAKNFNGDITSWDVKNVEFADRMFAGSAFNRDISLWKFGKNQYYQFMFYNTPFNFDLSTWDVRAGCYFGLMFSSASSFNQDLNTWRSQLTTESACIVAKNVVGMFSGSGCPIQVDPLLPNGPFCQATKSPSASPSQVTSVFPSQVPSRGPSTFPSISPTVTVPRTSAPAPRTEAPFQKPTVAVSNKCVRKALNKRSWCCQQRAKCLRQIREACRKTYLGAGSTIKALRRAAKKAVGKRCDK